MIHAKASHIEYVCMGMNISSTNEWKIPNTHQGRPQAQMDGRILCFLLLSCIVPHKIRFCTSVHCCLDAATSNICTAVMRRTRALQVLQQESEQVEQMDFELWSIS